MSRKARTSRRNRVMCTAKRRDSCSTSTRVNCRETTSADGMIKTSARSGLNGGEPVERAEIVWDGARHVRMRVAEVNDPHVVEVNDL